MLATAAAATSCWLRSSRSRYVFFLLCSPILIPIFCATFPFICAIELCIHLARRVLRKSPCDSPEIERLQRCEEGNCRPGNQGEIGEDDEEEINLLQRYLDDQLLLVRSVYECGDDDDDGVNRGVRFYDINNRTPLLG